MHLFEMLIFEHPIIGGFIFFYLVLVPIITIFNFVRINHYGKVVKELTKKDN